MSLANPLSLLMILDVHLRSLRQCLVLERAAVGGGRDDGQIDMVMDAGDNISTAEQEYNISGHINDIRRMVDDWRRPKRFTRTEKYFYPLITDFSGYISEARLSKAGLSVARDAASRILCLPIYPDLPDTVVHKIIEVIKKTC